MKKPLISIIMPTYNRADLIKRAIKSILFQTYENWELIIVDDCSTDDTKVVVQQYKDERISYIYNPENLGANYARNVGITNAAGELITFLDSDNEWVPNKLKIQLSEFTGDCFWSFSAFEYHDWDNIRNVPDMKYIHDIKKNQLLNILTKRNIVDTGTLMVKKECFDKVGLFDEEMPRFQDYELAIRLAMNFPYKYIDNPLLIVHKTAKSISTDYKAMFRGNILLVKKHYMFFDEHGTIYKHLQEAVNYCINYKLDKNELLGYLEMLRDELSSLNPHCVIEIYNYAVTMLLDNLKKYQIADLMNIERWKQVCKELGNGKKVYIYGAGEIAQKYCNYLQNHNISIKGFLVTDMKKNKTSINGYLVQSIDSIILDNSAIVVVATDEKYHAEIYQCLSMRGIKGAVFLTRNILLDLENKS